METSNWKMGAPLEYSMQMLKDLGDVGIIGLTGASGYWGLSSYDVSVPVFLVHTDDTDLDRYKHTGATIRVYTLRNDKSDLVDLGDGLFVTDKERTICDMIEYDCHEFHLFECLISAYVEGSVNVTKLEERAERLGILEKLHSLRDEALKELDDEDYC